MSVKISGHKELDSKLKKLAVKYPKIQENALQKAAQAVADQLEKNTPYDAAANGKHLKDDVQVSKMSEDGRVSVGYGKLHYRAHWLEWGTIYQPPQGHMQHTEDQMRNTVLEIVRKELKKGLGL
ncbi:HK97-gp10 family putative phage morphogenesis protein [Terribacillus sp. 7520-G]|uniref:HK97-gp10 family putative phage morphogenesis protein n=1 Tax=Terribacillus sp. 7520-G TaxID=2025389 RepID=UPI000BA55EDC|nr:HK97-gp10 family putative phage morphogenesis protein [Terribacillus sp. 7520-G]PAD39815.1 hypothetical protein CHH53_04025 [Terribacillus sp. 7520-G]